MKPKNKFMEFPVQVLEELQAEELGFVVAGGTNTFEPLPNNGSGTCAGANNGTGTCAGTNNSSGLCSGTNNNSGSCNEVNNGSGKCDSIVNPRPDNPLI